MNKEDFLGYLDIAFDMKKTTYGKLVVDNSQPLYFGRNTIEIDELGKFNSDDLDLFQGEEVFISSNVPIKGLDLKYFKLFILKLKFNKLFTNELYQLVEMTENNLELFKEFFKQEQINNYQEYYAPYKHDQMLINDKVTVYALIDNMNEKIVASCIVIDGKLIEEIGVHQDYRYQGLSQVMISNILQRYNELYLHCEEEIINVYKKHNAEIITFFEGYEAAVNLDKAKKILKK